MRVYHLSSLDEDKGIKRIIRLFEKNSTIIASVGDMTVYVVPLYYFIPTWHHGGYLLSFLVIKRDPSGYIIRIEYLVSEFPLKTSRREEAEEFVDEKFGGFIRLLEKAVSTGSPNATKLAEMTGCWGGRSIEFISFLYGLYGDEILNDDTIPGLYSTCFRETNFFVNDKVIILDIHLWVVRDIHSGKIFSYSYEYQDFYEVLPNEKIFFNALFEGHRDLLEPEAVVEDRRGNKYSVSSSSIVVDRKNVSLVAIGEYDPEKKSWRYLDDIFAITCDKWCSIYSFKQRDIFGDISMIDRIDRKILEGVKEALIRYIPLSKKVQKRAREEVTKYLAEKYEWEILPA
jgi:hypothetical protein